ncbi:hypothetical protein LUU34_01531200 [Aix galericulata]|nr:hypothetical protein LUU34_01531200 [Aix galericulata]
MAIPAAITSCNASSGETPNPNRTLLTAVFAPTKPTGPPPRPPDPVMKHLVSANPASHLSAPGTQPGRGMGPAARQQLSAHGAMPGSVPSPGTGTGLSSRHLARLPAAGYFGAPAAVGTSAPGHPRSLATTLPPTHWGPGQQRPLPVPVLCILRMPPGPETCRWGWKPWGWHRPLGMVPGRAGGQFRGPAPKSLLQGRGNNPSSSLCSP